LWEKGWPQMNADERGLKIKELSASICVHPRLEMSFSASC